MYDIRFINRTDEQCYARKVSRQNRRKLPAIFFYSVANLRYAFELKKKRKKTRTNDRTVRRKKKKRIYGERNTLSSNEDMNELRERA